MKAGSLAGPFMSLALQDIPKHFQRLLPTSGNSTQHDRDMPPFHLSAGHSREADWHGFPLVTTQAQVALPPLLATADVSALKLTCPLSR
jgi:hypothetical protein